MDLVSMSLEVSTTVSCFRNIILCIIILYCALFIVNNIVKPPESDSPKSQDLVVTYRRCSGDSQNQTNDVYFEKSSYTSTFWERIYCKQFVSYVYCACGSMSTDSCSDTTSVVVQTANKENTPYMSQVVAYSRLKKN